MRRSSHSFRNLCDGSVMESLGGSYDTLPGVLRPTSLRVALQRSDRIVLGGLALIVVQVAFRAWALAGSWFYFDDLAFMSQAMNEPFDASYLFQSYGGHLMPGGFASARALTELAPYTWWPWALFLLVLQTIASLGMLRLLLSMFGRRPLVLVLLAGFLFYVFTLSAGIWWAAGINQLPLLIALVFGLHAYLDHLRTRRWRSLAVALVWTVVGLLFYEKTLLLIGVYAIITLAYFTTGDTPERLRALWRDYRAATISFAVLGAAYLGLYVALGPDIATGDNGGGDWGLLAWNLVMVSFTSAIIGGPLTWQSLGVGSLADPAILLQLASWAALVGVVVYARTSRTHSLRAWAPLIFTLTCNAVLLASTRAAAVGPDIAREYRYQTESGALFVIAAGLAFLPLVGAHEQNAQRPAAAPVWERRRYVGLGAAVVTALALVSSTVYVDNWQDGNRTRAYFDTVRSVLEDADTPPPLVDAGIAQDLLWSYRYPENTYSHMFRELAGPLNFPKWSVDNLFMFDDDGHLAPVTIPPVRSMVPTDGCGYRFNDDGEMSIPLDGPVIGGGWWLQISYFSDTNVRAEVVAGDSKHDVEMPRGGHNLYVSAEGEFQSVELREDGGNATGLCVTAMTLGLPIPTPASS
jgi:heme/copper-type cytochrome/quinol oxidase subunit 2